MNLASLLKSITRVKYALLKLLSFTDFGPPKPLSTFRIQYEGNSTINELTLSKGPRAVTSTTHGCNLISPLATCHDA